MKKRLFWLPILAFLVGCTPPVSSQPETPKITILESSITIERTRSKWLDYRVTPFDSDLRPIFSSADESIATIDEFGLIDAIAVGETILTAKLTNEEFATVPCIVVELLPITFTMLGDGVALDLNEEHQLTWSFYPENSYSPVTWLSSNPSVATVDNTGLIKAVRVGTTTISGTTENDLSLTYDVQVIDLRPTSIKIDSDDFTLDIDETKELTTTILPSYYNPMLAGTNWESSNPAVATIAKGSAPRTMVVTAVAAGTATITATISTNIKDSVTVTVNPLIATSLTFAERTISLEIGFAYNVQYTLLPEKTSDKTITWTTNNASVATVDAQGRVVAVDSGMATITGTTANGLSAKLIVMGRYSLYNQRMTYEVEPNDSFETAQFYEYSTTLEGELSSRTDEDFYQLILLGPHTNICVQFASSMLVDPDEFRVHVGNSAKEYIRMIPLAKGTNLPTHEYVIKDYDEGIMYIIIRIANTAPTNVDLGYWLHVYWW